LRQKEKRCIFITLYEVRQNEIDGHKLQTIMSIDTR